MEERENAKLHPLSPRRHNLAGSSGGGGGREESSAVARREKLELTTVKLESTAVKLESAPTELNRRHVSSSAPPSRPPRLLCRGAPPRRAVSTGLAALAAAALGAFSSHRATLRRRRPLPPRAPPRSWAALP
jgi:hypothetical protein